jgi:tRNA pseudouridine55 synthase
LTFILVDKPEGLTSHQVVRVLKKHLNPNRIGHLGTLDPFASGLLPIMLNGTTRLADEAHEGRKGYEFTIAFGLETDTLDSSGAEVEVCLQPKEFSLEKFEEDLQKACKHFQGAVLQTPPAYSALKYKGRPLYEYMRTEGKLPFDLADKTREVFIESLEFLCIEKGSPTKGSVWLEAGFRVYCQKGTYVRTLCKQIANYMGFCGFCSRLRRIQVGPWSVNHDKILKHILELGTSTLPLSHWVLPLEDFVPHIPVVEIPSSFNQALSNGNVFSISALAMPEKMLNGLVNETSKVIVKCGTLCFLTEINFSLDSSLQMLKVHPKKKL